MKNVYTGTAQTLHWLMAAGLFALLALGFYMHDLPLSPEKLQLYSWHKWAGVTAFLLLLTRLAWRLLHAPPALPRHMPTAAVRLARVGHAALYVLMAAIPLTGWLMSSAKRFQTVYFGILPPPDLVGKDKELGDLLALAHRGLNIGFIALLAGHVGAALKHHFIDKDDILARMLPRRRP